MSVVIVNWNSYDFLRVSVAAVRRFSSPDVRVIVVDNGSTDESVDWLRSASVDAVLLDRNVGHGAGLDLGVFTCRTAYFVVLDVDAFPIAAEWIETVLEPLVTGRGRVSGARGGEILDRLTPGAPPEWRQRTFVHPCFLAMDTRHFARAKHSFRKGPGVDVGGRISKVEEESLFFLEPTSTIGPGPLGTVFGDVVFHNFYATRHHGRRDDVDGIAEADARRVWSIGVERHLGVSGGGLSATSPSEDGDTWVSSRDDQRADES